MPASLFAGIGDGRTQIIGVKQNGDSKLIGQFSCHYRIGGKFSKFLEGQLKLFNMLSFDIYPRTPRYSNTAIMQTDFQYGMASAVFAGGVMKEFTNSGHFFCTFNSLGVIDDKKQVFVLSSPQAKQHIEGDFLHNDGFIPLASPEEFTVVGAVCAVSQESYEPVDSAGMTDAYGQYHRPEVII